MSDYRPIDEQDNKRQDAAKRVWNAMIYPESARPDWLQLIEEAGIRCAVSPLHDRDRFTQRDIDNYEGDEKPEVGDLKKPHYHIVLSYTGKRRFSDVWDFIKTLYKDPATAPIPKLPRGDIRGAVRYLVHMDNKDKAQYSREDVKAICGFDVGLYFKLSEEEEDEVFDAIMQYVIDHGIVEYWDILFHLKLLKGRTNLYAEMYRYCRKHPNVIASMIKSRRYGYTNDKRYKYVVQDDGTIVPLQVEDDKKEDQA